MNRRPTSTRETSAIAKRQIAIRNMHWPDAQQHLWDRKAHKGFTTIPKTMPLILKIMDEMTKGTPVSSTYVTLWCHTWDNSFLHLKSHHELANVSGFGGQRGEYTWRGRVKKLCELRFIGIAAGKSGSMSNAIIWNPHLVIRWHYQKKTPGLIASSYNALIELALEVGAKDMLETEIPDFDELVKKPVTGNNVGEKV